MNTANILGSHLNPQQSRLFHSFTSPRKRWIWSPQEDHLQLFAAQAGTDALAGKPVIVWYDDPSAVEDMMRQYPFYQIEKAIYAPGLKSNSMEEALRGLKINDDPKEVRIE